MQDDRAATQVPGREFLSQALPPGRPIPAFLTSLEEYRDAVGRVRLNSQESLSGPRVSLQSHEHWIKLEFRPARCRLLVYPDGAMPCFSRRHVGTQLLAAADI